jgi:hypothetical protein
MTRAVELAPENKAYQEQLRQYREDLRQFREDPQGFASKKRLRPAMR